MAGARTVDVRIEVIDGGHCRERGTATAEMLESTWIVGEF